jgi:hypothetical protein
VPSEPAITGHDTSHKELPRDEDNTFRYPQRPPGFHSRSSAVWLSPGPPNHYSQQQLEAQTLFQALRIACTKDHLTGNFANLSKSEHPGGFFLNRAARAEAAAALLLEGKAALTI